MLFRLIYAPTHVNRHIYNHVQNHVYVYNYNQLNAVMKHMNAIYADLCSCWHTFMLKPMFATNRKLILSLAHKTQYE